MQLFVHGQGSACSKMASTWVRFVVLSLWTQSLLNDVLRASVGPCTAAHAEAYEAFGPRAVPPKVCWFADIVLQATAHPLWQALGFALLRCLCGHGLCTTAVLEPALGLVQLRTPKPTRLLAPELFHLRFAGLQTLSCKLRLFLCGKLLGLLCCAAFVDTVFAQRQS